MNGITQDKFHDILNKVSQPIKHPTFNSRLMKRIIEVESEVMSLENKIYPAKLRLQLYKRLYFLETGQEARGGERK